MPGWPGLERGEAAGSGRVLEFQAPSFEIRSGPSCGGTIKIIECIEDPPVIERILNHLASKDLPDLWPQSRAPPVCVQQTGRPTLRTGVPD